MKMKFILIFGFILFLGCDFSSGKKQNNGIVITSPNAAEIVSELIGNDRIIGVTKQCDFPKELQEKEIVGDFGKVNIEKIIELNPSLILTSTMEQQETNEKLKKLKLNSHAIEINSIKEYKNKVIEIAKLIDAEEKAEKLIEELDKNLADFQDSEDKRPKIYVEIYGNPIMTVSPKSFVGELIKTAGGENIFKSLPREYCRVSSEKIINRNPDIILTTYPGITKKEIKNRMGWEDIEAVKNDRIYTIEDINPDLLLRASPRFIDGIKKLKEIFYEK